ncbi:replication initiation protein RepC (plasmid) [Sinorhizobium sp. B11]
MQTHRITTPFGRRPMTLALVKGQLETSSIKEGKSIDKWKVFRDVCQARSTIGIPDRALTVLDALLTFLPSNELTQEGGLVVFPSNLQLSVRAHGIAGTTLRRHLAALVEAGLIVRKDSPNGKRYARRNRTGKLEQAFGFSLAPLLSRAEELAELAQSVATERRTLQIARENLSLCRRDIRKLISVAVQEGVQGDWALIESRFRALLDRIPRTPLLADLEPLLENMEMLREEIVNQLDLQGNSAKPDGNAVRFDRHLQNSDTESSHEFEPDCEKEEGRNQSSNIKPSAKPMKVFPLELVLQACPAISDYAPGGGRSIGSWREMMAAGIIVRSMLGVSPSAYQRACEIMGPENAAVAMACILERAAHITSPGGYLRDLTGKAARGEFSLAAMLMALYRSNAAGRDAGDKRDGGCENPLE